MFNIAVKVNLSNGNTGTITIPVNTDWDNSTWVDGSTTIEYYKKIGSVSGPLIISSGGKQAARKLTISAPHADSVNVIAAGYRVHYTGVSSGQAASEIIAS